MTAKVKASWEYLFPINEIFGEIMIMVGRESLDELLKCRQVCQKWNVIISQMTKFKKDTIKRKADSSAALIRDERPPDFTTTASLIHHGFMDSFMVMILEDLDLVSVPAEHLASLAASVTEEANISNVTNCDLTPFLDNIKCNMLYIKNQRLGTEETRALVRAMESHVDTLRLEVKLDIRALTQYTGEGKCQFVLLDVKTRKKYRRKIRRWVKSKSANWFAWPGMEILEAHWLPADFAWDF